MALSSIVMSNLEIMVQTERTAKYLKYIVKVFVEDFRHCRLDNVPGPQIMEVHTNITMVGLLLQVPDAV